MRTITFTALGETKSAPAQDDGFAFWHGLVNAIIPALVGWLLIFGMFYAFWVATP